MKGDVLAFGLTQDIKNLKKRPILVAVIGYVIGIIVGLYYEISIVLFYAPMIVIYVFYKVFKIDKSKKFRLLSLKRYLRYLKLYLDCQVIFFIIVFSVVSNTIVIFQNRKYEKVYSYLSEKESVNFTGVIVSEKQEKQYYNKYLVQINYNLGKIKFYITVDKEQELQYGDMIVFSGVYKEPEKQRNYKGFDYSQYLKQFKIYGTISCDKLKIIGKNHLNTIFLISNNVSSKIILNSKKVIKNQKSSVFLGLMLGDKSDIDEKIQENFENAGMAHILAVSGLHVSYVILGVDFIFRRLIGKRKTYFLSIFILIFYMFITNFSPSITRAGIMGIIMIFSKLVYRKNDFCTSISISLFLSLLYNPFLIQNLGLQLSFGGVCGIYFFNKSILQILKNVKVKNKVYKYKIRPKIQNVLDKIKDVVSVSLSVQIFIFPILVYNLNTFNLYFLISNLILSVFIGPILILCFLFLILVFVNQYIANFLSNVVQFGIQILELISRIGELPNSKVYISTLSLFFIFVYYLFFLFLFFIYDLYSAKNLNKTQVRFRNLIALLKLNIYKFKKFVIIFFIFGVFMIFVLKFIPKDLKLYFLDVGQGDASLLVTPHNKTVLLDGGGSVNSDFDVGKNILVPYILDRGFSKIDVVFISHFDNDHVRIYPIFITRNKSEKCYYRKAISKFRKLSKIYKNSKRTKYKSTGSRSWAKNKYRKRFIF